MELERYPMDVQSCFLDFASYAYTEKDIKYFWKRVLPIQLKEDVDTSLHSFELLSHQTDTCTSVTTTGALYTIP